MLCYTFTSTNKHYMNDYLHEPSDYRPECHNTITHRYSATNNSQVTVNQCTLVIRSYIAFGSLFQSIFYSNSWIGRVQIIMAISRCFFTFSTVIHDIFQLNIPYCVDIINNKCINYLVWALIIRNVLKISKKKLPEVWIYAYRRE